MPQMLDDESNVAGQLYRGFLNRCYDWTCR